MEENLNQDLATTDDIFADVDDSEDVTETPEETAEESTEVEESAPVEEEPFLDIVYNKETKKLSKDEARTLAQKGMNYDHLKERYAPIEELARLNNMDVNSFINSLGETQRQFELDKEMKSLREQYPDTNQEVLKELAQSRAEGRVAQQRAQFQEEESAKANAQDEQVHRDLEMFKKEFPGVDYTELPQEVYDNVRNGLPLLYAYSKYLRSSELAQSKVDQQNKANKAKSLGNTSNAGEGVKDDFLSGLNS